MERDLVQLQAAIDQDRAECDAWFRESSMEAKEEVLAFIAQDYGDTPLEIMSRLAQLAFSEAALRYYSK